MEAARQGKDPTELELFHAKKAVKDLVFMIEQSSAEVRSRKVELQSLRRTPHGEEDSHQAEIMQQLDCLKEELGRLKLGVSSAVESKAKAEKDIEFYSEKTISSLIRLEELRKEIEEANEEHVFVELARIEAERELREIVSERAAEAMEFSKKMKAAKERTRELQREISRSKELEEKLAATKDDISVLQNEMELVRAMEKNFHKEVLEVSRKKSSEEEQLRIAEDELTKAKKELKSIKDEGFQFMASMDNVREELLLVSSESNRMQELEKNVESTIGNLNLKLMKAKSKLKSATSNEERTRGIVTNISSALQQLQSEAETAKEEKERAMKETSDIKQEAEKIAMSVKSKGKKLWDAVSKLGTIKAAEFAALVKLKSTMEEIVKSRALASQNSTTICVSNWEYEYLIKRGESAQEVADKKLTAINGWIEALGAQEKEILLKSELVEEEIKAMRDAEEKVCNMEVAEIAQKAEEEEANEFADLSNAETSTPAKIIGENSLTTRRRSSKIRRTSAMAGIRSATRSPSFTIKKKKRLMPNLGSILRARTGKMKRNEVDIVSYANLLLPPENDHSQNDE